MLAARTSAARSASRIARQFSSVVDTAGIKVAAVDNGEPTSAVTFLVKAGSRFETKPGVAHALKNFAFKSTNKRSALGTVRESELYGGVLSSSLSREHLALTAEFLRGDESFFVDTISSFLTDAKFTRHELQEYVAPVCAAESTASASNPASRALELAHIIAFRNGLGSPLFASEHSDIVVDNVKEFASSVFSKGNVAVLGTGISQEALSRLVEKTLASLPASAPASSTPTKYFGGESRVESHGDPQTIFIGFGTTGAPSAELAVLAAHLNPQSSIKWAESTSPLAAQIPATASVQAISLPYSDASLFGLIIQGETAEDVKVAGKAAVDALKAAGSLSGDELKRAVAKAKFAAANAVEGRSGLVAALGPKVLAGSSASVQGLVSSYDKVDASAFSQATSTLLKAKPTFVAIGDIQALPYADELGL